MSSRRSVRPPLLETKALYPLSGRRPLVIAALAVSLVTLILAALLPSAAQADATDDAYTHQEIAFVGMLNDYRAANGLAPLLVSDLISEACRRHDRDMAKYCFFDHYSQRSDWFSIGATPWSRMALSGYSFYTTKGENVAAGQATAAKVFEAWKKSPGHNANMLNPDFRVVGIDVYLAPGSPYTFYWTTDFGGYADWTAHPPSPLPVSALADLYDKDGLANMGRTGVQHWYRER